MNQDKNGGTQPGLQTVEIFTIAKRESHYGHHEIDSYFVIPGGFGTGPDEFPPFFLTEDAAKNYKNLLPSSEKDQYVIATVRLCIPLGMTLVVPVSAGQTRHSI